MVHALLRSAKEHIHNNELAKAVAALRAVTAQDPGNPEACFELGKIAFMQHDLRRARQRFAAVLHRDPQNLYARLLLGKTLALLERYPEAARTLEKAKAAAKKNTEAFSEACLELGKVYFITKKYPAALRALLSARALRALDTDQQRMLASTYKHMGKTAQAIHELKNTLRAGGLAPALAAEILYEIGVIKTMRSAYGLAIKALQEALAQDPAHVPARILLAQSYKQTHAFTRAIDEYTRLIEGKHRVAESIADMLVMYRTLNSGSSIITLFTRHARTLYRESPEIWVLLMNECLKLIKKDNRRGEFSNALNAIQAIEQLLPGKEIFYANQVLSEKEIAEKKIHLRATVRSLTVTLNNRCNLDCIMCPVNSSPKWNLSSKTLQEVVSLFPYLEKITWVGGEVFLYPGFAALIDQAAQFHVRQTVVTSGLLLDRPYIRKFLANNIDLIISIDGVTPKTYEHIRRGGRFARLLKNLNDINALKTKYPTRARMTLYVVVMKSNYRQIERFIPFAAHHGFTSVILAPLNNDPNINLEEDIYYHNPDTHILAFLDRARPKLEKEARTHGLLLTNLIPPSKYYFNRAPTLGRYVGSEVSAPQSAYVMGEPQAGPLFCHAPWIKLHIGYLGEVRPSCHCALGAVIGNSEEQSIKNIWNSEKMKKYRAQIIAGSYRDLCSLECAENQVPEAYRKLV